MRINLMTRYVLCYGPLQNTNTGPEKRKQNLVWRSILLWLLKPLYNLYKNTKLINYEKHEGIIVMRNIYGMSLMTNIHLINHQWNSRKMNMRLIKPYLVVHIIKNVIIEEITSFKSTKILIIMIIVIISKTVVITNIIVVIIAVSIVKTAIISDNLFVSIVSDLNVL